MPRLLLNLSYLRIFFIIALAFILLVAPFSFYLSYVFSDYAYKEIDRFNEQKLKHTRQNAAYLADKLKTYSLHVYQDAGIQQWFESSEDENRGMLQNAALIALTDYIANEPFIYSAYLVNMRTGSVIDYRSRKFKLEEFHDQAILKAISEKTGHRLQYIPHEVNGKPFLALIVPSGPGKVRYNGYLVLLFDRMALETHLLQSSESEGIEMFVADAGGRLVLGRPHPEREGVLSRKLPVDSGRFNETMSGHDWSVRYASVPEEDWTIYYMTRMSNLTDRIDFVRHSLVWGSVLLLGLLLAVIFWNTRTTYKGIRVLEERVISLNTSIRRQRERVKSDSVRQWLLQGKLMSATKNDLAGETDLLTRGGCFIAILRIDRYKSFCEQYELASRNLLKFAMLNIATEILGRNGRSAEGVDLGSDHLVLVLGSEEDGTAGIVLDLQDAVNQIESYLKIQATASVSERKSLTDDLREAYDRTFELTTLKFLSGERKIYLEEDRESYSSVLHSSPQDLQLDGLLEAVRFGKSDQMEVQVAALIRHLQQLGYNECQFQLQGLIYTLYRSFGHFADLETEAGIRDVIDRFGSLNELGDWLVRELKAVIGQINLHLNQPGGIKEKHMEEILSYIEANLSDPNLSVTDIADHVSLSAGYVRQIFKEKLQITVADYIRTTRTEYVKDLMRSTSYSAADIAEMAGFLTKSHFFTTFKKATGMTPQEYRRYAQADGGGSE